MFIRRHVSVSNLHARCRRLYWTETEKQLSGGGGRLMRCRLDGSQLTTVLGRRRQRSSRRSASQVPTQRSSSCSCPADLSVAPAFAIDCTQPHQLQQLLYVADNVSGDIWATDSTGCHCRLIVNATTLSLTPSDIGQSLHAALSSSSCLTRHVFSRSLPTRFSSVHQHVRRSYMS